jgi:hypothetical protein
MEEAYLRYDMSSEICQNICECYIEHILTKMGMNTKIIIYNKCTRSMDKENPTWISEGS